MQNFIWSRELSIGIDAMDAEHRKIIQYMNALAEAWERRAPVAELDAAFTRLAAYTRRHFADEERYMESFGFAKLSTHKLVHRNLLNEMDRLYQEFRTTGILGEKLFRFLSFWLKSHICGIDRQYAEAAVSMLNTEKGSGKPAMSKPRC